MHLMNMQKQGMNIELSESMKLSDHQWQGEHELPLLTGTDYAIQAALCVIAFLMAGENRARSRCLGMWTTATSS